MTTNSFRHNHYVPEWYQRRFLPDRRGKFHYLDLHPETVIRNGKTYTRNARLRWGPPRCFAQDDLYTTSWDDNMNTDIERFFFGRIDTRGRGAVEFFSNFAIRNGLHEAFEDLVRFMSVQKLRTPKGLAAFAELSRLRDRNLLLIQLQRLANVYCATWTDAVWQIADATSSSIKFLLSDHPITIYNRGAFPGSKLCRGFRDPDIRLVASQTLFPLSADRALFLTNLSWVRNPYQHPLRIHPNPRLMRTTMFKATDIQRGRSLSEEEVLQVNHIIKSRAFRYIAAPVEDWLYPEKYLESTHWSRLGDGFLLMPEPRDIHMGGTIYVGYKGGRSEAWNEYGHRPWESEFENKKRFDRESANLTRFQNEFAARFGPKWRGWSENFGSDGPREDRPEFFEYHVREAAKQGVRSKYTRELAKTDQSSSTRSAD